MVAVQGNIEISYSLYMLSDVIENINHILLHAVQMLRSIIDTRFFFKYVQILFE